MTINRALLIAALLISILGSVESVSAQTLPALPNGTWQFLNTCFADYDVGGGKVCAAFLAPTAASSCGSTNAVKIQCFHSTSPATPNQAFVGEAVFPNLPAYEVAMAVDESGNPWVLAANNNIYYGLNGTWNLWRSLSSNVGGACANQIAVQGGTVMVRGCDAGVYAYIGSAWELQLAGIRELSVGANQWRQDGSGVFYAMAQNYLDYYAVAPFQPFSFALVNTKSNGAAVNLPTDCYYVSGVYTCQRVSLLPPVHQGGGELSFVGQYPQGNQECTQATGCVSNPAPVCTTTHTDPNSSTGLSDWFNAPWFASFTVNARDFSSFDLVGTQQIDRYFDTTTDRMAVQVSQYRVQSSVGVCSNLTPAPVMTSNKALDGTPIGKLREGTKFGHLGGAHSLGVHDVRWLINGNAQIWWYETP